MGVCYSRPVSLSSNDGTSPSVPEGDPARRPASGLEKSRARGAVSHAIRTGRLERRPCEWVLPESEGKLTCGERTVDGHHDDYARPLDVRWLCRRHHRLTHAAVKFPLQKLRAGSIIAWRRLVHGRDAIDQIVFIANEREIVGVWIPAVMLDPLDFEDVA